MLAAAGIIGEDERDALLGGLDQVAAELEGGTFPFEPDDVDIHMAVERRLTDLVGPSAASSTPRARATTRSPPTSRCSRARTPLGRSTGCARCGDAARSRRAPPRLGDARLHAPPARPARLPLAPPARLLLDVPAATPALPVRALATEELPLGAGALAGVNFDTDRGLLASELGFASVAPNSIDAVSNRDFVLDYLAPPRPAPTHLSRLGPRSCCGRATSSASARSRTRGRRAPRSCRRRRTRRGELLRRQGAAHGGAPRRGSTGHARPAADLQQGPQEDKEHLFDAVDTARALARAPPAGCSEGIAFRRERLAAAAADELIAATDIADLLVRRGVPFRQSHGIVAGLVRETLAAGPSLLRAVAARSSARHSPELDDEFYAAASSAHVARVRRCPRAAPRCPRVREQLAHAAAALDAQPVNRAFYERGVVEVARTWSAASCATARPPA
jgi:argininosuccinate lyase